MVSPVWSEGLPDESCICDLCIDGRVFRNVIVTRLGEDAWMTSIDVPCVDKVEWRMIEVPDGV